MKKLLIILVCLMTFVCPIYAYRVGDVVVTKEGDKGVVFYADQEKILIVNLKDDCSECKWSNNDIDIPGITNSTTNYNKDFGGKSNTESIKNSGYDLSNFPAIASISTKNKWYLPSIGELVLLNYSVPIINPILSSKGEPLTGRYCSSSEYDESNIWCSTISNSIEYVSANGDSKTNTYKVRSIREFKVEDLVKDDSLLYKWNTGQTTQQITDKPQNSFKYQVTVTNEYGCKNTVDKTVAVISGDNQEIFDTICAGDTYHKFGFNESASGTYKTTIQTVDCSEEMTLHLWVNPKYEQKYKDEICQGEYYDKYGFSFTPFSSGLVSDTLKLLSETGCDSTIIIDLNVLPISYDTLRYTICQTEGYKDEDFDLPSYMRAGLAYHTIEKTNGNGCKLYHTLALQVDSAYQIAKIDSICQGEPYNKYGFSLEGQDSTLVHELDLKSKEGCDSIVRLRLVVVPQFSEIDTAVICQGDSVVWRDSIYKTTGIYTDSLISKFGCDSVYTLNLTVGEIYNDSIVDSLKAGLTYNKYDYSFTPQIDTVLIDTMQTILGCDSIRNIFIKVIPADTTFLNGYLCDGKTFTLNGTTYEKEGLYQQNIKTEIGADSVIVLTLKEVDAIRDTINVTLCEDNETYTWDGHSYDKSIIVSDTLTSAIGCDSIITLNLVKNKRIIPIDSVTICAGESAIWRGYNYTIQGIYFDTIPTTGTCDSIFELKLTVNKTYADTLNIEHCDNEESRISGIYIDSLSAITGCDSLIITDLKVHPTFYDTTVATISEGEHYLFDNIEYRRAGSFKNTYQTTYGCDSIRVLKLGFYTEYVDTVCSGDIYTKHGFSENKQGTYKNEIKFDDVDSISVLTLKELPKSSIDVKDTVCQGATFQYGEIEIETDAEQTNWSKLQKTYISATSNQYGCDSIINIDLLVRKNTKVNTTIDLCEGNRYTYADTIFATTGNYNLYREYDKYCETDNIVINVHNRPVIEEVVPNGADYQVVYIHNEGSEPYKYIFDGNENSDNVLHEAEIGPHLFILTDAYGCSATKDFYVDGEIIPMPYFTPNGDGINDVWQIKNIELFPEAVVKIFDRWGKLLTTFTKYNNTYHAWDGTYNGYPMPTTDYWYTIEDDKLDKSYSGHFTLLR